MLFSKIICAVALASVASALPSPWLASREVVRQELLRREIEGIVNAVLEARARNPNISRPGPSKPPGGNKFTPSLPSVPENPPPPRPPRRDSVTGI